MVDKNRIINETIKLLRWGQKMPIFSIKYTAMAMNSEIEDFIRYSTDEYDEFDKKLSDEEYENIVNERIERFHNSPDFKENDFSTITLTQCIRVSDIGFEFVRDILEGKKTGMSCFIVNDIQLVDYQIV